MTDTRPLTWQERQRHQQTTSELAAALAVPPVQAAMADSLRRIGVQVAAAAGVGEVVRRSAMALAASPALHAARTRSIVAEAVAMPALARIAQQQRVLQTAGTVAAFGRLRLDGIDAAVGAFARAAQQQNSALQVAAGLGDWHRNLFKGLDLGLIGFSRFGADVAFLGRAVQPAVLQIAETLRGFSRMWESAGLQGIGRTLARVPMLAALAARRAALHGDWEALKAFVWHWLDRRPTWPALQAAAEALLDDGWLPESDLLGPGEVIPHLRSAITSEATRRHKLLGDTQLLGRRLDSLDRQVPLPGGGTAAVVDLHVPPGGLQDDSGDDPRLARALPRFAPDEVRVLQAWAPGMTWSEAAQAAGLPTEFGETVRRKRKRVVGELKRRRLA